MEPQASEPFNTYQAQEFQAPKHSNTNKFLILIFGLLVIIANVVFWYFSYNTDRSTSTPQITGLEVALETATFLDSTIQPDGSMMAGFGCSPNSNECNPIEVSEIQPHLGQAIYAYYLLAEATGDQSYRMKADQAMSFVLDRCQTNVQMCAWNFFPLARYYFDTKEEQYLQGMLKPAEQFLSMFHNDALSQNVGHKLASLYQATGDERYKKRLLEIADTELLDWAPDPEVYNGTSIQVVWSLFLPAYAITQDKKYLMASEKFFDTFDFSQNLLKVFKTTDPIIKGIDALLSLGEISEQGALYRAEAHEALQITMNQLWDNPTNSKVNGDYGFVEVTDPGKLIIKKTLSNGWIMKSFIRLADDKFNLIDPNESEN